MTLRCSRCDKRLSRKAARMIDGKLLCSTCMFAGPVTVRIAFTDEEYLAGAPHRDSDTR
jgi:hypothetical protein